MFRLGLISLALASCRTYDGKPIWGTFARVSPEDLRAATIAVRPFLRSPGGYEIISETEIHVLERADRDSSYRIARKSGGRWREAGGAIVLTHEIRE